MPGEVAIARGRTTTALIRSHAASEDKRSRLNCAIPPCPPNASVTNASTRNGDSAIRLSLSCRHFKSPAPRPRAFVHGKCRNSAPILDARVTLQPSLHGRFEAGLGTLDYPAG